MLNFMDVLVCLCFCFFAEHTLLHDDSVPFFPLYRLLVIADVKFCPVITVSCIDMIKKKSHM